MNILEQIIAYKRNEVARQKIAMRTDQLEKFGFFNEPTLSLKASLQNKNGTGIIAEFKKRSPSKGVINAEADVFAVTAAYARHGAAGLSILTDSQFFGGSTDDLLKARTNSIPILRKEFIIDEYQLVEARSFGADVILLIAACLSVAEVKQLAMRAKQLGLEVLLELHDEDELNHICDEIDMVGVNNRSLKTFKVDIDQSVRLAEKIGNSKLRIAESGISEPENIRHLRRCGFDGFLIGERFMKEADPGKAFEEFVKRLQLPH